MKVKPVTRLRPSRATLSVGFTTWTENALPARPRSALAAPTATPPNCTGWPWVYEKSVTWKYGKVTLTKLDTTKVRATVSLPAPKAKPSSRIASAGLLSVAVNSPASLTLSDSTVTLDAVKSVWPFGRPLL